ncbi:carbon starvation CstA family protein [uncultured Alistipes sp.]|uniref:carbon starvation CstA family protein n=1 Tax=uncultured Alistipes sp. TaxID=538949 RepID=UPI00260F4788|nr:carbon starvation CstA family protein [uncultured Alistipes sp.]
MITFLICLALLVGAYFTYGRFLERLAGADERAATPCRRLYDGVDYVPLPRWRVFLIQLLNIAGTGPIFGAVLGACFGPVAFLWITLGGIFMGAMHDYLSGMMLVRHDGLSIPEVAGRYLGGGMRRFMRLFSVALLVLVGAVFLLSPAQLLGELVPAVPVAGWVWIILAYYFVATLLPIDRLIGRVYPLFGVALVAMALGLLGAVVAGPWRIPELTTLSNFQLRAAELPIVPTLFIIVACGAISGFHATQSPLMARCVGDERACRPVFYGAMISESIIALVWAAVAMAFFGGAGELSTALSAHGDSAAWAVGEISHGMLGLVGGALALLGVVAAPVTSGDTAFRSARLIVADMLRLDQRSKLRRLAVSLPLLAAGYLLTRVDFGVVWRYFAWTNQTLAVVVLWAIVVYLVQRGAPVRVALWPALFMTFVCASFVFVSDQFLGMECRPAAYALGGAATLAVWLLFRSKIRRDAKGNA